MRNPYLPTATAALFIIAALVACHGIGSGGGYTPTISQDSEGPFVQDSPFAITCKAPQKGGGKLLEYFAPGNVKGSTFKAITGKNGGAAWLVYDYEKVRPTPTPSPTPTPQPTATPKPVKEYLYYGSFAMKDKQAGCAYLITTVNGKDFKHAKYNADTSGFPRLKLGHYKATYVESGIVSALVISHLSSRGGSGTATLLTAHNKIYTTGSISLVGRRVIVIPDDLERLLQPPSDGDH